MCPYLFESLGGVLDHGLPQERYASSRFSALLLVGPPGDNGARATWRRYRKEPAKDELDHDRRMGVDSVTRLSVQRG